MARLLIVEDDASYMAQLRRMLADRYELSFVENEEQALKAVSLRSYDLVIVELFRKNPGLDGLQILQSLRDTNPTLPLICISARGPHTTDYFGVARLFGATAAIAVPFETTRLTNLIDASIDTAGYAAQPEERIACRA
jgi:two-component system nitrogen regulation response regulator NtrX